MSNVKVGDIIRSTVDYHAIKAGQLYAVETVVEFGGVYVIADSPGRYLTCDEFEANPKPQVGDTIEALIDDCDTTEGSHYVVTSIDPDGDVHYRDDIGDDWWLLPGQYKLVPTKAGKPDAKAGKPKAGDKVKVTVEGSYCFTAGKIYEVIRFDDGDDSVLAVDDEGDENWLFDDEFELVIEQTAPEPIAVVEAAFKVGDRIRVKDSVGVSGVVVHVDGDGGLVIKRDDGDGWPSRIYDVNGAGWFVSQSNAEIFAPEPGAAPTFKPGDRVKLVDHPYILDPDQQTGVISCASLDGRRGDFRVAIDNYGDTLGFYSRELQLLADEVPAPEPKFKVGDRVVARDYGRDDEDCYGTVSSLGHRGVYAEDWSVGCRQGYLDFDILELVTAAPSIPEAANDNTVTVTLRKDATVPEQLEAIAAALRAA